MLIFLIFFNVLIKYKLRYFKDCSELEIRKAVISRHGKASFIYKYKLLIALTMNYSARQGLPQIFNSQYVYSQCPVGLYLKRKQKTLSYLFYSVQYNLFCILSLSCSLSFSRDLLINA